MKAFKRMYIFSILWILVFVGIGIHEFITSRTGVAVVGSIWTYAAALIGIGIGIIMLFVTTILKRMKERIDDE